MHRQSECSVHLPAVGEKFKVLHALICQRSNLIIEFSFGNIFMSLLLLRIKKEYVRI